MSNWEYSCGAVTFTREGGVLRYVLIHQKKGWWSFPKGHMERGECERETALREIYEEVGLRVRILDGFRREETYPIQKKPGTRKHVTYFCAEYEGQELVPDPGELLGARLATYEEAMALIAQEPRREILTAANDFLLGRVRGGRTAEDMCVPCADGYVNLRVGAIIRRGDRFLMVGNSQFDYLYSVGGRIRFGETAEQAVVREVFEETGAQLAVDRLGFVHEDYFLCDAPDKRGKPIYELCFYFYMKTPEDFEPVCRSFTGFGAEEYLTWASCDDERRLYPAFFRTELRNPAPGIRHIVVDERPQKPVLPLASGRQI